MLIVQFPDAAELVRVEINFCGVLQHFHSVEGFKQRLPHREHAMVFHEDADRFVSQASGYGVRKLPGSRKFIRGDDRFVKDGIGFGNEPDIERLVHDGKHARQRRVCMDNGLHIRAAFIDFQMHRSFTAGFEIGGVVDAIHVDFCDMLRLHVPLIGRRRSEQHPVFGYPQGNIAAGRGGQALPVKAVHAVGYSLFLLDHFSLSFTCGLRNGIARIGKERNLSMLETVRWITAEGRVLQGPETSVPLLPGKLRIIDQTRLPQQLVYLELDDVEEIAAAIERLSVRGAPAIGCAAALGLAACAKKLEAADFPAGIKRLADRLAATRPTAVNLFWALDRCRNQTGMDALIREALSILEEDILMCRAIGEHGAPLIKEGMGILTHCNAGALATGDFGTALSPLYVAHAEGRSFSVYSDETRPLLQGSRLTAWELQRAGIDVTTICDSMAAQVMKEGRIDLVIVGSDRIAANGDAANKIGTYGLAILAKHHGIPFYVAAPTSTVDASLASGDSIPIERRDPSEVAAAEGVQVYNPAFDVSPHSLISGIITEKGVHRPPFNFN